VPLGVGDSREAAYTLAGPLRAGTWHLVGDGELITRAVDVRFDIVWRPRAGADTVIATVSHRFTPPPTPNPFGGATFEADLPGIAAPAARGDSLVLRFNVTGGESGASYTPNGDGALANARVPNLTLP
jgi:hypothetical protein